MALYELTDDIPEMVAPALIVAFDGWVNAGMARWEANVRSSHERLSDKSEK